MGSSPGKIYPGKITGWGIAVPSNVVTNDDLAARVETSDQWIFERTGIRQRRVAGPDDQCSTMAVEAGKKALKRAGRTPSDVELIIVATSSPDYNTPPVACQVQHLLGAEKAGAFSVVLGCAGFVCSLVLAEQFIATSAYKNALVIGVELLTRNINWEDRNTCVLFGDGAGAVFVERSSDGAGMFSFVLGSDGSGAEHLIQPSGGSRLPPTAERIAQGLNCLQMNGPEVFKFATRVLGRAVEEALAEANLTSSDIDLFIPHQANARIIDAAARHLGLSQERVFLNVDRYGNTSAASIPIALCEALEAGRAQPGDTLALVSFGAGLSWASAIIRL